MILTSLLRAIAFYKRINKILSIERLLRSLQSVTLNTQEIPTMGSWLANSKMLYSQVSLWTVRIRSAHLNYSPIQIPPKQLEMVVAAPHTQIKFWTLNLYRVAISSLIAKMLSWPWWRTTLWMLGITICRLRKVELIDRIQMYRMWPIIGSTTSLTRKDCSKIQMLQTEYKGLKTQTWGTATSCTRVKWASILMIIVSKMIKHELNLRNQIKEKGSYETIWWLVII